MPLCVILYEMCILPVNFMSELKTKTLNKFEKKIYLNQLVIFQTQNN
jgi:hypothetical protein